MTTQIAEAIMNGIVIGASMLSVVFALGIVWRVEKELDISFKLFSLSIISFLIGEIVTFFHFEGRWAVDFLATLLKLIFAILFLLGMLAMRDLLRKMDGENNPDVISDDALKNNPPR
jgi:hypothetical protein